MMGQVGTPVVAVESGYVEALGWNQYGGWRLGIRSFDHKRYYYYAHLRKNYPYQSGLEVGSVVQAGDVIGYLGRTGYSRTENTNNIDDPHLHFGLELIFDESQKDSNNEIWVSCYELVKFLNLNRCETVKVEGTKEWKRVYGIKDPSVPAQPATPSQPQSRPNHKHSAIPPYGSDSSSTTSAATIRSFTGDISTMAFSSENGLHQHVHNLHLRRYVPAHKQQQGNTGQSRQTCRKQQKQKKPGGNPSVPAGPSAHFVSVKTAGCPSHLPQPLRRSL